MNFTETHHAFISATFFRLLKEENSHNFRAVFRMAVQIYAGQRGSRMAQRALRDEQVLDFATYRAYGEWEYSKETLAEVKPQSEMFTEGIDLKIHAFNCSWAAQYKSMGLEDGGIDYCDDLDRSIARGFNPDLAYEVSQTQSLDKDYCIHYHRNALMDKLVARNTASLRPFEFHCAQVYHTFSQLMAAVYRTEGVRINTRVLEQFASVYGQEMADKLLEYRTHDFKFIE